MSTSTDITLPIVSGDLPEGKTLDMDRYLRFVQFCLAYVVDLPRERQAKRLERIDVRFSLDEAGNPS